MPTLEKDKICPFFKHNLCLLGDDCRLSHRLPVDGADDSDSSDEESKDETAKDERDLKNANRSRDTEVVRGTRPPLRTQSPSAGEIAELKREIERAIKMTTAQQMPKQPTATVAVQVDEAPPLSVPLKVASPQFPTPPPPIALPRPRWTSVKDDFERLGALPPPPPEPFLGNLNVDNEDDVPIKATQKTARYSEKPLSASPILGFVPTEGLLGPESAQVVDPKYSVPSARTTESCALGAIPKVPRIPPLPAALPARTFRPLRRPAPSIKIPHYCHTCKQDVGTVSANMTCPLCFGSFIERSDTVERTEEVPPSQGLDTAEGIQKLLDNYLKCKYYCYECKSKIEYVNPSFLRCPKCNSSFIEEIASANTWIDKDEEETETATVAERKAEREPSLAALTARAAQPVVAGDPAGYAWVPPEGSVQAFLSKEDKFRLWAVNNKFIHLEDDEHACIDDEFPDLPPPSLPGYGTMNAQRGSKPRSLSCGTNRDSCDDTTDDDEDDDEDGGAWEKVATGGGGAKDKHPNRVSRLEKRRLKKELRKTTLRLRRAQEMEEREKRDLERKLKSEEAERERIRARKRREDEDQARNAKAGEVKRNLNLVAAGRNV